MCGVSTIADEGARRYMINPVMTMDAHLDWDLFDEPVYTAADVSAILRVPYQTVRYWVFGRRATHARPLVDVPDTPSRAVSFANLLECHVLNSMRTSYDLDLHMVRQTLDWLAKSLNSSQRRHPLLTHEFLTDGISLFIEKGAINASQGGQATLLPIVTAYLQRIVWSPKGFAKFYPFVMHHTSDEPRLISISPAIAAGRSVIDGTGISTAVIMSRVYARESAIGLALEYRLSEAQVLEAVIWEAKSREFRSAEAEAG